MSDIYHSKIQDEWLPFPDDLLERLGWKEGDEIGIEVCGDTLLLTKLADGSRVSVRKRQNEASYAKTKGQN